MCDVDLKDWANVTLCDRLSQDVLLDLKKVYNESDALKLYCIAILRVCNPGIKDCELKEAYDNCFLSETYPDVALSRNTVCEFLNNVGKACSRIVKFMRLRTEAVNMSHHLLVDGLEDRHVEGEQSVGLLQEGQAEGDTRHLRALCLRLGGT